MYLRKYSCLAVILFKILIYSSVTSAEEPHSPLDLRSPEDVIKAYEDGELSFKVAEVKFLEFISKESLRSFLPELQETFLRSQFSVKLSESFELKTKRILSEPADPSESIRGISQTLKKIYPSASPIRYSLRRVELSLRALEECGKSSLYPACLWVILFEQEGSELLRPYTRRLLSSLNQESLNSLDHLILYRLSEYKYADKEEERISCDNFFNTADISKHRIKSKSSEDESRKILFDFIREDSQCKLPVLEWIKVYAFLAVKEGSEIEVRNALKYFEMLDGNGTLHKELVLTILNSSSLHSLAREYVDKELFSKLSQSERISLIISGKMPFAFYLIAVGIFIFLLFILLLFIRPPLFLKTKVSEILKYAELKKEEKAQLSRKGYEKLSDKVDEYTALLMIFGLNDDATDGDIKRAYRDKVKLLHPDTGDASEQQKFQEVKRAYERLLSLRRGWFVLSKREQEE